MLLDYDHTLYPSTGTTLKAVDFRITEYIKTFLGFSHGDADSARLEFCAKYGTTLKGLEVMHGVNRDHYTDFIHAIPEHHLPPQDPDLVAWMGRVPHPVYIFTNARMDWAIRGLKTIGLESMLPLEIHPHGQPGKQQFQGILDIVFMDWQGKPHPESYDKVEVLLRQRHGNDIQIHFADDRIDNLETAQARGWTTIWIPSYTAEQGTEHRFDLVLPSLTQLDPHRLL